MIWLPLRRFRTQAITRAMRAPHRRGHHRTASFGGDDPGVHTGPTCRPSPVETSARDRVTPVRADGGRTGTLLDRARELVERPDLPHFTVLSRRWVTTTSPSACAIERTPPYQEAEPDDRRDTELRPEPAHPAARPAHRAERDEG